MHESTQDAPPAGPSVAVSADSMPGGKRPGEKSKIRRMVIGPIAAFLVVVLTGWMGLAVYYTNLHGAEPRTVWAILVVVIALGLPIGVRPRRWGLMGHLALFGGVVLWFFSAAPSSKLDWADDVAVMPTVSMEKNLVHLRGVRHFNYRSETDFTPRYDDRTYDLDKLRSVDYILSYWSGRAIAHAFVSFGFDDGRFVAISIETRKQKNESYSAIQGFFRQYELIYVVADERDVIRLRTNFRGEDVYLFRLRTPPRKLRAVFLDYLKTIDELSRQPRFYNALTENCTTSIFGHFRCAPPYPPLSFDVILNGYSAEYAYRTGALDTRMPFEELEARSRITDVAKSAGDGEDFSQRIRKGLPMPTPNPDPIATDDEQEKPT